VLYHLHADNAVRCWQVAKFLGETFRAGVTAGQQSSDDEEDITEARIKVELYGTSGDIMSGTYLPARWEGGELRDGFSETTRREGGTIQ